MEKNKELTPMMELYQALKNTRPSEWNDLLIQDEKRLIEKEKQVNEEFFLAGKEPKDQYPFTEDKYESFETYYNTKYNNQIK